MPDRHSADAERTIDFSPISNGETCEFLFSGCRCACHANFDFKYVRIMRFPFSTFWYIEVFGSAIQHTFSSFVSSPFCVVKLFWVRWLKWITVLFCYFKKRENKLKLNYRSNSLEKKKHWNKKRLFLNIFCGYRWCCVAFFWLLLWLRYRWDNNLKIFLIIPFSVFSEFIVVYSINKKRPWERRCRIEFSRDCYVYISFFCFVYLFRADITRRQLIPRLFNVRNKCKSVFSMV